MLNHANINSSQLHSLRKKFIKAYNFPIQVLQDPYFTYLLDLYDKNFSTYDKYTNVFLPSLKLYDNPEDFFQGHNRVINDAIEYIRNTEGFQKFNSMGEFEIKQKLQNKNIYIPENNEKMYISVDIKKANFSVLQKQYNISPYDNYYDFISMFTNNEFFKESKHLRQKLFGYLNPKRQQRLQKSLLNFIMSDITNRLGEFNNVFVQGSDEIIMEVFPGFETLYIKEIEDIIRKYDVPLNMDTFKITQLSSERNVFVKDYGDDRIELKNVPNYFYPQYFKYYLGLPIYNEDLVFYHDGKLANFLYINEDIKG